MPESSLLATLVAGRTSETEERQILELLTAASPDELNALLEPVDCDALLSSVDDRVIGPDHRAALVRLLAHDRRDALSLQVRADLIHALQTGRTDRAAEDAICALFCSVGGTHLTHLKNLLNSRQDFHDLEGLIFSDIEHESVRSTLLAHIAAEAAGASPELREAKVLSDIDDTAFSRLKDEVFARGAMYPGVLAFWDALDDGPHDEPFDRGDLTFVTARPMDAFGLLENHSRRALRRAGVSQMSMLSGGFANLHTNSAIAEKKLENVDHYARLFPEYDLVFVGDSGQGDVMVGEEMMSRYPGIAKAVFIHDVVDTPEDERAGHAQRNVFFHDTYVGAAVAARRVGLISAAGLDRVCLETCQGFETVGFASPGAEQRARAWLDRDLSEAATLH
ncbi:hypothetical protein GCM10027418_02130 [Mariniluteicoccus endophyticus]